MKVTWEPEDIKPGLEFGYPECHETSRIGFLAPGAKDAYTYISMLDGMVQPGRTKEALAAALTEMGAMPVVLMVALDIKFGK